MSTKSR